MQTNSNREKMHKVTKWREPRKKVIKGVDRRVEREYVRGEKEKEIRRDVKENG